MRLEEEDMESRRPPAHRAPGFSLCTPVFLPTPAWPISSLLRRAWALRHLEITVCWDLSSWSPCRLTSEPGAGVGLGGEGRSSSESEAVLPTVPKKAQSILANAGFSLDFSIFIPCFKAPAWIVPP